MQVVKQARVNIEAKRTKPKLPNTSLTASVRTTAPFSTPAKAFEVTIPIVESIR